MKLLSILAIVFSLAALGVAFSHHNPAPQITANAAKESAFDRVMRTGVLRCGYYTFQPMVIRDPNTSQLSGLSVDMMNKIADKTGLKIEWTEEITFGNWIPALQAGRFDAICTPMWPDMSMGREVLFTKSIMYSAIAPVVRIDDNRFNGDTSKINDPSVTIVVQEGNVLMPLTTEAFPKAKQLVLTANSDPSLFFLSVLDGKADVMLVDRNGVYEFNRNNGIKAKMLDATHPVKAQQFDLVVNRDEFGLRDFLDNAILDMQSTGSIDRLLTKWEAEPGMYLRAAEPYRPTP